MSMLPCHYRHTFTAAADIISCIITRKRERARENEQADVTVCACVNVPGLPAPWNHYATKAHALCTGSRLSQTECVYATKADTVENMKKSRDGLVCCRLCWHPSLGAEWNHSLLPPLPSLFGLAGLADAMKREGGGESERVRQSGLDVTCRLSEAPSWAPAPCFYACLIGQKQHACKVCCLCVQCNGKTLERT